MSDIEHDFSILANSPTHHQERRKTRTPKPMRKTLKSTATLSNLLPTGAVFINQLLSPVLTNKGQCTNQLHHTLTVLLLVVSATASFILRFTDTVKDEKGKVRHGIVTFSGLWIVEMAEVKLSEQEKARYKAKGIDFVHASLTVLVYAVVAFCDKNIAKCFFPEESELMAEVRALAPAMVGAACSVLFVMFPTGRHGIGYPLSKE
ncbi:hypothetical protein MLD38_029312 [Melastoma candidum]|uniref:Uncharacterized protein n=1 Tax=Melastoma candidum TaxID=119954 RepID=A0ACB9N5U9_9MYRT|nr:hypothetical protein MLD38_029312 [Melastoma candidum]